MASGKTGRGRGIGGLLVLLLLGAVLWWIVGSPRTWVERLDLEPASRPSEELARAVEERLDRLVREGLTDEMRFSELELQSFLTYRPPAALPAGVEDPRVAVRDSIVVLSARVRPDRLDGFGLPESVRPMLEDTTRVLAGLLPRVVSPGTALLVVRNVQVGEFAIPPILIPALVRGLRQQGVPASDDAVRVRVPRDVRAIRIEGDDLVLSPRAESGTEEGPLDRAPASDGYSD